MPPVDLNALRARQGDVATLRAENQAIEARLAAATQEITRLDEQIAQARARGDTRALAGLTTKRDRATEKRRTESDRRAALTDRWREVIGGLQQLVDANDAPAEVPLLLLPVRIETRYSDDRARLRVRIFPDDVHVDSLERGLAETEVAAGQAYWSRIWRSPPEDVDAAWRELITAVGRTRARWTALATQPSNLARRTAEGAPVFPAVAAPSGRPALARLLPDHFTVVIVQGAARETRTGNGIPEEVVVGLLSTDGTPMKEVNGVTLVDGAEWIADYAIAERQGLAVTVPLPQPGRRIDRLFVFGVRRSSDPKTSAQELSRLLEAHAGGKGLAFVAAGTPTNNTETGRAGWQRREDPPPVPRDPVEPTAGSNAALLADALGVPAALFSGIDGSDDTSQPLARHAAIALWPATWGTFLDRVDQVGGDGSPLPDADKERARRFARDFVRGRGPLPMMRIGRQPYGVLPVSCVADRFKTAPDDAFGRRLLALLRRLRVKWLQSVAAVPRIGEGDIDKALADVLGMAPASFAMRVRTVLSNDAAAFATSVTGAGDAALDAERLIDQLVWEDFVNARLAHPMGSLSDSRPLRLKMTDPKRDAEVLRAIVAGQSPTLSSVLQALVMLGWDRARREVDRNSGGRIADVIAAAGGIDATVKERIVGLAARADRNENVASAQFFAESERIGAAVPQAAGVSIARFQPFAPLQTGFGDLALKSTNAAAREQLGGLATLGWLESRGRLAELREAIEGWAQAMERDDEARRAAGHRLLFAETIDCTSHRLDAWLTGLVEQRRRTLSPSRAGISIGAFGWVEGIEPAAPRDSDGGYLHAPSMAHAATAGILRSAYLTHNTSAADAGAFSIDLSSRRVRAARQLLDGVRQGQTLSALSGYSIERAIHEARLDRLILSLRTISPLRQGRMTDRGEATAQPVIEALAANNVVDGVDLVEKFQGKVARWDAARIRTALSTRPTDNPYLEGDWPALTDAEWQAVAAAIEAAAAELDAVADLLMAESVHQLAQGNVVRASAALDAAAGGDSPPPEPDVIASRIDAVPLTHRLLLIAAANGGWNAGRPRAAASPELEAWVAARLGDPGNIVVARAADGRVLTFAESGLCALDLVHEASNRNVLEHRLKSAIAAWPPGQPWLDVDDGTLAAGQRAVGDVAELAESLRVLLAGARPIDASDLWVAGLEPTRSASQSSIDAARVRLQGAIDVLDVRAQTLEAQLANAPIDPAAVRGSLEGLAAFGVSLPPTDDAGLDSIARTALAEARRRVERAEAEIRPPAGGSLRAEQIVTAGQTVFGDGFWVLPAVAPPSAPDAWQAAFGATAVAADEASVRRYLVDAASVRDSVRRYVEVLMLADAVGVAPSLRVAQIAGAAASIPTYWVGDRVPDGQTSPQGPVATAVVDIAGAYDGRQPTVGLLLDHWVDMLPLRERRGDQPDAPIDERVTTGVAFQAQAAGARAPQSWLLAISPDGERWDTARLAQLLEETLDNAKLRLVTLEYGNGAARALPALYAQSWSLQGEKVFDPRFVAERINDLSAIAAFVKEA